MRTLYKGEIMNDRDNTVNVAYFGTLVAIVATGAIVDRIRDRKLSKAGRRLKSHLLSQQLADARKINESIRNGTYIKEAMEQLKMDCEYANIVIQEV
jgi:hypothetical protein